MATRITKTLLKEGASTDRESIVFDAEVRGLGVRFRPGYSPSWFFRYTMTDGRRRKITIGFASEFTPETARGVAREYRDRLARGEDPAAAKEEAREVPVTVADLAKRYMEEHAGPNKKPRSAENDEILWRLHILPKLGEKRVDAIDDADVTVIKNALSKRHATANQALALLSKAFNLAEMWKYRPRNSNPCAYVKKFPPRKRERILQPDELHRFGAALDECRARYPHAYNLIIVMILTGGRWRSEIAQARLTQFDPHRGILDLPDSKTGQGFITLSRDAVKFLQGIQRGSSPWLIPGPFDGHPVRVFRRPWRRILQLAKIEGLRPHDLRHVFGSYSGEFGANQRTIQSLLRHKQGSTTERYLHGRDQVIRDAADRTSSGIRRLMRGEKEPV